jgi:hypothetical protein
VARSKVPPGLHGVQQTPEEKTILKRFITPLMSVLTMPEDEMQKLDVVLHANSRQVWFFTVMEEFDMPGLYMYKGIRNYGKRSRIVRPGDHVFIAFDKRQEFLQVEIIVNPDTKKEESFQYRITKKQYSLLDRYLKLVG